MIVVMEVLDTDENKEIVLNTHHNHEQATLSGYVLVDEVIEWKAKADLLDRLMADIDKRRKINETIQKDI